MARRNPHHLRVALHQTHVGPPAPLCEGKPVRVINTSFPQGLTGSHKNEVVVHRFPGQLDGGEHPSADSLRGIRLGACQTKFPRRRSTTTPAVMPAPTERCVAADPVNLGRRSPLRMVGHKRGVASVTDARDICEAAVPKRSSPGCTRHGAKPIGGVLSMPALFARMHHGHCCVASFAVAQKECGFGCSDLEAADAQGKMLDLRRRGSSRSVVNADESRAQNLAPSQRLVPSPVPGRSSGHTNVREATGSNCSRISCPIAFSGDSPLTSKSSSMISTSVRSRLLGW